MPSEWQPGDSLLLAEWIDLLGGSEPPAAVDPMSSEDALVIVDMQKDFVPGDETTNPDGGRFGVAEGDHIAQPIVRLIQHAAASSTVCVATRDYHPFDHVSFSSEGGPFPEHCVQGTPGAEFLPSVATALAEALQAQPERVHVAFKAFHEDVDSFGAMPYASGGDGRIAKRTAGSTSSSGRYCVGCAACPWSGSILLKQSAIAAAARRGVLPDPNAPPDVLAVECDDEEMEAEAATALGSSSSSSNSSNRRGAQTLERRLRGCKRLFVCGLALDFCVLDTCLNAVSAGFDHVVLLLDAARAAHIPGVGPHGTGFLSEPKQVLAQLREARVVVTSFRDAVGEPTPPPQSPQQAPRLHRLTHAANAASAADTDPAAAKGGGGGEGASPSGGEGGGAASAAASSSTEFPSRLGPLGIEITSTLAVTVNAAADRFTVALTGPLASLASLDFANGGNCSPAASLPLGWPGAPPGAVGLRWAYPVDGMAVHERSDLRSLVTRTHFLGVETCVEKCFVAYGGFLLLDEAGAVLGVQAIMAAGSTADATRQMHFSPGSTCPPSAVVQLKQAGRVRAVTLPYLLRRGAESFCWVHPSEAAADDAHPSAPGGGAPPALSEFGAFLYTLRDAPPVIFHLINPQVLQQAHAEMHEHMRAVDRQASLRRALTMSKGMQQIEAVEQRESARMSAMGRRLLRGLADSPGMMFSSARSLASLPGASMRRNSMRNMLPGAPAVRVGPMGGPEEDADEPKRSGDTAAGSTGGAAAGSACCTIM